MTEPYYSDDHVTIYHGDALMLLEQIDFDIVVTDPPYGINWSQPAYNRVGRRSSNRTKQHDGIANDDSTAARNAVIQHLGNRPALIFGSSVMPIPQSTKAVLVWAKPKDTGFFGHVGSWRRDWEPIYVLGRWKPLPARRSSILRSRAGSASSYAKGVHPHAKPVDVMTQLIEACPAGVILDPFMGSGSTLRAAKDLGRKAIGIEIEERYCEIAARRMAQEVLPL